MKCGGSGRLKPDGSGSRVITEWSSLRGCGSIPPASAPKNLDLVSGFFGYLENLRDFCFSFLVFSPPANNFLRQTRCGRA